MEVVQEQVAGSVLRQRAALAGRALDLFGRC